MNSKRADPECSDADRPRNFDSLLSLLGGRGRYSLLVLLAMALVNTYPAAVTMSNAFTKATTEFRCSDNDTAADCTATVSDDQCSVSVNCSSAGSWTQPCRSWTFDKSLFESTIISKFLLVCDSASLADLTATLFFAGFLVGSTLYGAFSDKLGRHKALLVSLCNMTICLVVAALAPAYWLYTAAMALTGIGTGGLLAVVFTFTMEATDAKNRVYWIMLLTFGWATGAFLMMLIAYLDRNYQHQLLWVSASTVLLLPVTALVGESPRWLASTGRVPQAQAAVLRVAKMNGTTGRLPANYSVAEIAPATDADSKGGSSIANLFLTPGVRRMTLLSWSHWFVASMTYYGISLGAEAVGGNIFVNSALFAAIEVPARLLGMLLTYCGAGRKPILYASFLLSAAFVGAVAVFFGQQELQWVPIVLAVLSKLCITVAFEFVWIYYSELYPTVIRTAGVGSGSTMARLGAMVSTQVLPLRNVWAPLPFLIFGVGPFAACMAIYFLPETSGRTIPETIADGEAFLTNSTNGRVGSADP